MTKADWEYATPAGSRSAWMGSYNKEDVCRCGNVADQAAKAGYPDWSVFSCDDRFLRLAPMTAKETNA